MQKKADYSLNQHSFLALVVHVLMGVQRWAGAAQGYRRRIPACGARSRSSVDSMRRDCGGSVKDKYY
jgi:hypothetical protein